MQKINFKNLPDTSTPLSAENLNLLQDNIESAIEDVEDTIPTIENSLDSDSTTDAPSVHAVNEKINEINDYSTNEIKVGTWINNKPLYRKVLVISQLAQNTQDSIQHNIPNVDFIYVQNFMAYKPSSNYSRPLMFSEQPSNCYVQANRTYFEYKLYSFDTSDTMGYAILEYTKTTD